MKGNNMKILVDADACPVKDIIVSVAKKFSIPVTMIMDTSHQFSDGYSTIITVDTHRDSADFLLIEKLSADDIVVTQDFGLAAMALGKNAKVLNQNGLIYTNENIDRLLMERHISGKIRRSGGRTRGMAKRTKGDNEKFKLALEEILNSLV